MTGAGVHNPFAVYRAALAAVQRNGLAIGAVWFLQFETAEGAFLCGLPRADKWKVLKIFKTACINYGVTHAALVKFLKALDADHGFELVECDPSVVSGRFIDPLKNANETARRLARFCPFVAEEDGGDLKQFARALAKTRYFKLWWD
jgi:hypothetical protein